MEHEHTLKKKNHYKIEQKWNNPAFSVIWIMSAKEAEQSVQQSILVVGSEFRKVWLVPWNTPVGTTRGANVAFAPLITPSPVICDTDAAQRRTCS